MRTRSLRKVFLSIKGIYYQAEVMGQTITWIVPYQFTQTIPSDVDVRVMLTFLELYQTLLGFVFFKLYSDLGLVYPPPLDVSKDEAGAGVGAYTLQENTGLSEDSSTPKLAKVKKVDVDGKTVTGRDVKKAIKAMGEVSLGSNNDTADAPMQPAEEDQYLPTTEEFIPQPSSSGDTSTLPTLHTLATLPSNVSTHLFAPYTFFLSRETPRSILEFVIRSSGGKVGWPETVGSGSPFGEDDESITHVIIDRPPIIPQDPNGENASAPVVTTKPLTEKERRRKYVQPQWIVDCVNAGKILLEEPYGRGKILPPHLSPFGEGEGAYDPKVNLPIAEEGANENAAGDDMEEDEEEDIIEGEDEPDVEDEDEAVSEDEVPKQAARAPGPAEFKKKAKKRSRKIGLLDASADADLLRKAELEAERAGVEPAVFEEELKKASKKSKKAAAPLKDTEDDTVVTMHNGVQASINKMLMSNKQRKLYERMKHSQKVKSDEKVRLERKKADLIKKKKKEARTGKA
ncbi:mRNA-binding ribosome synthesis protein nop7 [Tulasnella sp. 418]|nr:mRNA-binding ribosome synthesis protein nop7 [Tulasnella sp. 418]